MATISTLDTFKPKPKAVTLPPQQQIPSLQETWDKYFKGDYTAVMNDAHTALFSKQSPDYLHIYGLSLMSQKRVEDAMPLLMAAITLYPMAPSWFSNASIAALSAGAGNEALHFATAGLTRFPNDPILNFANGNALMHLDHLAEAAAAYTTALKLKPDLADAKLNLGNVMRRAGRSDEALNLYTQVLNADQNNLLALVNRAGALLELNQHDEAAMMCLRVMAKQDVPEVRFMMAMLRMFEGDFKNGFDFYRTRFDCMMAASDKALFKKPLITSPDQMATSHLLLSHEQGFGDSLQFIRYLPMLADAAKKVTLLVPQTLVRLFEKIDPRVTIVTRRDDAGNYDLEVPMLHLPWLFGTTLETIPATIPYLSVPSEMLVDEPRMPPKTSGVTKRVGLVWAGQLRTNPDLAAVDRRRSMSYSQFETFLDIETIDFVSLQMGDPVQQIADQSTKGKRRPYTVLNDAMDFLDTAAVIMRLDLVITVDTAVAHLAAALGKPVWVLSRFDQCWRWMRDRTDSPWYPGVLRLFHQETPGDWSGAIADVKAALETWASQ